MKRTATAIWNGSGKEGGGKITSQSKALNDAQYSYKSRYEEGEGTNPEELIAAAHAGCFTMKLSFIVDEAGFKADTIETTSTVTLEGGSITNSHLSVKAKVPGITKEIFQKCADDAKLNCPVSKALSIKITMECVLLESVKYDLSEKL